MRQSYKNKVQYILTSPTSLEMLKNSISEKCSEKFCARMPCKRRSHFSGHFLSPDFGAFHVKLDFFNTHGWLQQLAFSGNDCRRIGLSLLICDRRRTLHPGWRSRLSW